MDGSSGPSAPCAQASGLLSGEEATRKGKSFRLPRSHALATVRKSKAHLLVVLMLREPWFRAALDAVATTAYASRIHLVCTLAKQRDL